MEKVPIVTMLDNTISESEIIKAIKALKWTASNGESTNCYYVR